MPFEFVKLTIPEIIEVKPRIFTDERGSFAELFKTSDFVQQGLPATFVQVNQSLSVKNVVRGLHYQKEPHGQGKLVTVSRGEVFDVAVDIRVGSPTFGTWVSAILSAKERNMLFIPIGFAHGFAVLSDEAEVIYYCTSEYKSEAEAGVVWNDPTLAIPWPIQNPILSAKDTAFSTLDKADNNFIFNT